MLVGVWVGARPYLRAGFAGMVEAALPKDDSGYLISPTYYEDLAREQAAARPQAVRDVLAERVIAVAVVLLGTFLNGYGAPLARFWGLHG